MTTTRIDHHDSIAGASILVGAGWFDTTDEDDEAPLTFTKDYGVGALQFSSATYKSGRKPDIRVGDLTDLVKGFVDAKFPGAPAQFQTGELDEAASSPAFARADVTLPEWRLVAWYVSNGRDVVLCTYTCGHSEFRPAELEEAAAIVTSMRWT